MRFENSEHILVLGAGNFGTCLAAHLCRKNLPSKLWARRDEIADSINKQHKNPHYLSHVILPDNLEAFSHLDRSSFANATALVFAVPTQSLRELLGVIKDWIRPDALMVSTAKGIEIKSGFFPSEIFSATLGAKRTMDLVTLSGPSFANEIAIGQPTGVSVASFNAVKAKDAQDLFHTPHFRAYTHDDPLGLEIAGAFKNVIAIAAGAAAGLGFQSNAHAVLVTRGLAEMARIGRAIGANPLTFNGLGGVGDLILTCSSGKSRNFTVGLRLARGEQLTDVLKSAGSTAEGVSTAQAAIGMVRKLGVDAPITKAVYEVLYENKQVRDAVAELMNRASKNELE